MRKILTLIMALAMIVNTTNAAFVENTKTEKKEQRSVFSSEEKRQAAELFVKLSRQDYEKITGKHLSLTERLGYKMAQKQMKKALKAEAESEGFNIGGFLLGFLVGLIGVLLAYIFSQDSNLRKWAWIGFGVYAVIVIIVLVAVLSTMN